MRNREKDMRIFENYTKINFVAFRRFECNS
jgi:hypothetical protein